MQLGPMMASGFGVAFASLLYVHDAQVAMIVGLKNIILIWGVTTMGLMLWLLTAWPTLPIGSSCLRQSKMWFFCGRVWWSRCTPSRVWDTFHMTGFILYASSTLQDLYKTLGCFTTCNARIFTHKRPSTGFDYSDRDLDSLLSLIRSASDAYISLSLFLLSLRSNPYHISSTSTQTSFNFEVIHNYTIASAITIVTFTAFTIIMAAPAFFCTVDVSCPAKFNNVRDWTQHEKGQHRKISMQPLLQCLRSSLQREYSKATGKQTTTRKIQASISL